MKLFFAICFSIFSLSAFSQDKLTPAAWSFEVVEEGTDLIFRATVTLDDGWAMYSQHTDDGGPIPLTFTFRENQLLKGETEEMSEAITKHSDLFDLEVVKFKNIAVFEQKFVKGEDIKSFSGELRFMCCDELRCLPPTVVPFDVAL